MNQRDDERNGLGPGDGHVGGRGGPHLDAETLARLVDDAPSPRERAHLEACEKCSREVEDLVHQTRSLGGLPGLSPPEDEWEAISARLALDASGRVVTTPPAQEAIERDVGSGFRRLPFRFAAGLALFLAGGAVGALAAGGSVPGLALLGGADSTSAGVPETAVSDLMPSPAGMVVGGSVPDISEVVWRENMTAEESEAWVRRTQRWHLDALTAHRARVGRAPGSGPDADPLSRLVLTENILAATEAAVREVPTDPFFNGLLVSTEAERRATFASVRDAVTRTRQESP